MKIIQVCAIPETEMTFSAIYALCENGCLYVKIIKHGMDINETEWLKITPPTADIVEGANLQHTTPQGQNGTAGKPQVGECTTSAIG
jgi:hypothetical protein